MRRKVSILAILGLGLAALAPASAEPTYSKIVSVEPGQLASADGVATLYAEIVDAARDVCTQAYWRATEQRACVEWTVAATIEETGIAELVAYHTQQADPSVMAAR